MKTPFRTLVALLGTCAALLVSPALVAGGPEEDTWIIAKTGEELSHTAARELILDGEYQMIKVATDGGPKKALLYQEPNDLEGHVPAQLIQRLLMPPEERTDPNAKWIGQPYTEFTFTDFEGEKVRSADLLGKVVVLNYWFIACAPCVIEIPMLNELVEAYAEHDDIVFVAATFDGPKEVDAFLEKKPFHYRQTHVAPDTLHGLGVFTYPTHIVLDRQGKVAAYLTGLASGTEGTHQKLISAIDREIERKAAAAASAD